MNSVADGEARTIRVMGMDREVSGYIERHRDFLCYGRKNVKDVCSVCALRFTCFSTREDIEISVDEFKKRSIRDVTVKVIANKFSGLKYKFTKIGVSSRVQINFEEVVRK